MIISFRNRGTADVYYCVNSNEARRVCPPVIWSVARRKLDLLNDAQELQDRSCGRATSV
ncbi:MAG TPA: hypothetical protein VJT67_11760 [Longimicrobiaceae bacterium]|nr:hypothetical protein [Longimicrobiaceae bacterium]